MASNVSPRMEYVGNAAPTTLSGDLSASGTSFNLTDPTAYPQGIIGKFVLVINKGGQTEEKILCDTRTGSQINADPAGRGYDGTLPQTHSAGESVQVCWPATAADEDNLHNNSTSGVHGVAGNVVGDTDTQTLTNKTVDGTKNTLRNVPYAALTGVPAATTLLSTGYHGTGTHQVTATAAAVDTTNSTVTFTAPASGKVLLRASMGVLYGNDGFYNSAWWQNRSSGAVMGVQQRFVANTTPSPGVGFVRTGIAQVITGLAAGTSYTLDLWASVNGGTEGCTMQDIFVEAWTA